MKTNFSLFSFLDLYPDENTCLEKLFQIKYGKLECCPRCAVVDARFYRVRNRKCFMCGECRGQLYPMAGTIMEGSTISLHKWFCAIFLFANSKNSVSASELERILGISYKAAWNMGQKIRSIMKEVPKLHGTVHIDESLFGGRGGNNRRGWAAEGKTIVFGMIEAGGRVVLKIIPDRKSRTIIPIIRRTIRKGSMVRSDKFKVYRVLPTFGYTHRVKDNTKGTNNNVIEGYWSNLKKSILGTHTWVSPKHLQDYLDEHAFRHNHRFKKNLFDKILMRV
jgi:transposase